MTFARIVVGGVWQERYIVQEELRLFCERHGIALDRLFDARGMKRSRYGPLMRAGGYHAAVGVTICLNGHDLRNARGQCIQCNPASVAFAERYRARQEVYVAQSKLGRLIKVGTSADLSDRFEQLNIHRYGGFADWTLLESVTCDNAGRVEQAIHGALRRYHVSADYGARPESCRELFRCGPSVALAALRRAAATPTTAKPTPTK